MSRYIIVLAYLAIWHVFAAGSALSQVPVVDSVSPPQNKLNVAPDTDIVVRFSEIMDQTTIDSSTFLVCGEFSGPHSGIISYDVFPRIATFDPNLDFAPGEQVTVVLTSGIESLASAPLDDYVWSFTTEAAVGPSVFASAGSYIYLSSGTYGRSIAAADFDGDNDIDLATPTYGAGVLHVLLNLGDGSFHYPYDDNLMPQFCGPIAVGDINGDDAVDIVMSSFEQSLIATVISNGDGTFAPYVSYTMQNAPGDIVIADFDLDGNNDLLAVHPSVDSVAIHFGIGDGTFAETQSFTVNGPYAVAAADFDKDGGLDIAVTSAETDSVEIILTGEITGPRLAQRTAYQVGDRPVAIISADLNGDQVMDLAMADSGSNDICVLLNDPGNPGAFLGPSFYAATEPISLDAADFDGDGDLDIAVSSAPTSSAQVMWNQGDGAFAGTTGTGVSWGQRDIIAADLDGDSDMDFAVVKDWYRLFVVLLNTKLLYVNPLEFSALAITGVPDPQAVRQISVKSNDPDLEFFVEADADWLTVTPSSGIVPADVTIEVITASLSPGDYTATIVVSADTDNPPQTVTFNLTVYDSGIDYIRLCVDSLEAGTESAEIPFALQRLCPFPERIMGISNGFTLHATGDATWEFVEYVPDWTVYFWWNLGGMLFTNGFNGVSPDTFLIGGAAMPPGGMPFTYEHYMMSLVLNIGTGEGEILIDSAFVFNAGRWRWAWMTCGPGGEPGRPIFLSKDSSDLEHPISIRIYPVCGDVDRSGQTDIDDVVFLVSYIFLGGPAPNPESAGDVDCSGVTDIDDVVYLMFYIFAGGPCTPCE